MLLLLLCTMHTVLLADNAQTGGLEAKPRWEFGVGGAYIDGFDYPASANPNRAGIVLPYAIYRSPRMRFAGRGLSAIALEKTNLKLDVSLAASLNADSEGNPLRESMPDLDFLFEFGPQLIWRLVDRSFSAGRLKLDWRNRARAVLSTDFNSVDSRGWVAQTHVQVALRKLYTSKLDLIGFANLTWATEKLHDYFYQVGAEFETPLRPRYDAQSGYLGATLFLGAAFQLHPRVRLFGGVQVGHYAGSANEDSPLFEDSSTAGAAVGFAWAGYKSKETVLVLEED